MNRKKISKSLLVSLIVIVALSGIVLAQYFMYVSSIWHFSIMASGTIALFETDGTTPFIGFTFAPFSGLGSQNKQIVVKNTGNIAVDLIWNATGTSWTMTTQQYLYNQPVADTLAFDCWNGVGLVRYAPNVLMGLTINSGTSLTFDFKATCDNYQSVSDAMLTVNIYSFSKT